MEMLEQVLKLIEGYEAAAVVICGVVWDLVRRMWPTIKPASILADSAKVLMVLSKICQSASEIVDKVVKQNVKEEPKK